LTKKLEDVETGAYWEDKNPDLVHKKFENIPNVGN
jgi:hypothetical protein